MGRNADGNSGSKALTDGEWKKLEDKSEPLANIRDRETYKEVFRGISRYEAVLGIRDRKIRLYNGLATEFGATGMSVHQKYTGKPLGIFLDKGTFDRKADTVRRDVNNAYKTHAWATTRAPIQHAVTHELAHASLNRGMRTRNALLAKKELKAVYEKWNRDTEAKTRWGEYAKSAWGRYAKTGGMYEFWAEGITKAVHGVRDSYAKKLLSIAKKYKL